MTRVSWLRVTAIFAPVGRFVIDGLALVGRVALFAFRALLRSLAPPYYPSRVGEQLMQIGWLSLPRAEGDYLISGNDWVALIMILAGSTGADEPPGITAFSWRPLRTPPASSSSFENGVPSGIS